MRDDGEEYVSHEEIVPLSGIQGCQKASNFFSRIPRSPRLVTSKAKVTEDHQKTVGLEKRNRLAIRSLRRDRNYHKNCLIPLDTISTITL